jgi:hypothetical protein
MASPTISILSKRVKVVTGVIPTTGAAFLTRPANGTPYAANDVVSNVTNNDHFTFSKVPNRGEIVGANLISSHPTVTNFDMSLWLFHTDIAEVADNLAFAATDAEMLTFVGRVVFPSGSAAGSSAAKATQVTDVGISYQAAGAGKATFGNNLYGQLVADAGYTPLTGEILTCRLLIREDSY